MNEAALFELVDGWLVASDLTTGPWHANAMHGGPPSALIGRALEQALEDDEQVARLNIDLERPVPVAPLQVNVTRRRLARRVAHLDLELCTAERVVTTARAVVLRGAPVPGLQVTDEPPSIIGAEAAVTAPGAYHTAPTVFHRDAVEHRFVFGGFEQPGPASSWIRLAAPLVAGEHAGPLTRLLAIADFGSAIGQDLAPELNLGLINVDVSLALVRPPVGEWFRLDVLDRVSTTGVGLAVSEVWDAAGRLGVATHSQLTNAYPR